jgi:hypothetical protein
MEDGGLKMTPLLLQEKGPGDEVRLIMRTEDGEWRMEDGNWNSVI